MQMFCQRCLGALKGFPTSPPRYSFACQINRVTWTVIFRCFSEGRRLLMHMYLFYDILRIWEKKRMSNNLLMDPLGSERNIQNTNKTRAHAQFLIYIQFVFCFFSPHFLFLEILSVSLFSCCDTDDADEALVLDKLEAGGINKWLMKICKN